MLGDGAARRSRPLERRTRVRRSGWIVLATVAVVVPVRAMPASAQEAAPSGTTEPAPTATAPSTPTTAAATTPRTVEVLPGPAPVAAAASSGVAAPQPATAVTQASADAGSSDRTTASDGSFGLPVYIHAFASQGFMLTTGNDYIASDTTHGSFQLSEVGLNVTRQLSDRWSMGLQLFAQNLGLGGSFNFKADWFYLDYRWRNWLGIRAGRIKIPYGLYNEVNDIDAARAPIFLPQSVYPLQGRSFLFAQTGFELYGFARARGFGALDYRLFVGTIFIDPAIFNPPGSPAEIALNVRYVAGGRLLWETPLEGLRVGGSVLAVHMDVTAFAGGMMFPITNQSTLGVGSLEYAFRNLVATAEYARWHTVQESTIPDSNLRGTAERMYAMVTYRAASWLQPALYYALFFPDVDNREGGPTSHQHDVSLTLRFDVTTYWIVKLEGHYMAGTAGVQNPLSVGPAPTDLDNHWGVFLVKTTGYF
jgi:hypothetical protein